MVANGVEYILDIKVPKQFLKCKITKFTAKQTRSQTPPCYSRVLEVSKI
jgi:hypothetical protein